MSKKSFKLEENEARYAAYILVRQATKNRELAIEGALSSKFALELDLLANQLDAVADVLDPSARSVYERSRARRRDRCR